MIPLRLARELTYQLEKAGEDERLARALACVPVFLELYKGEGISEVLSHWQQLSQTHHEPESYYLASLEGVPESSSTLLPEALLAASRMFESRGAYDMSLELLSRLLAWGKQRKNTAWEMEGHIGLGIIFHNRGDMDMALSNIAESLRLAEFLEDTIGVARAIGSMGIVHSLHGRFLDAIEHFDKQMRMAESLGDKSMMASNAGNMGVVYGNLGNDVEAMACFRRLSAFAESLGDKGRIAIAYQGMGNAHKNQGRYSEAIVCFEQAFQIAETLGYKSEMSKALGDLGTVYGEQHRYAEAMKYYQQGLTLKESIGNKRGMARTIGNIGILHTEQGRFHDAMGCFNRALAIAESVNDAIHIAITIGNMGSVYRECGRYEDALHSFRVALEGHRRTGFLFGVTYWLEGTAKTLLDLPVDSSEPPPYLSKYLHGNLDIGWHFATLRMARGSAEECSEVSLKLSKPDTIFSSRLLLARIDDAEGNTALATEKLEAMFAESTDEEQIADLHYWLWKISAIEHHHDEALSRYTSLYTRIPKFEFRKRIAELRSERVPLSAEELSEP